jgi:hypothetical protein
MPRDDRYARRPDASYDALTHTLDCACVTSMQERADLAELRAYCF